ncbi:MAG: [protein-PII] uridylyltransferase [Dactylosporangium sp.]|nr:[protein-PII] uridylyltransferase [Dactylosporangium sp.]NNJ63754.1 [protein-PII] uridylyltransferase [Dactylosporangium sp.]
MQPRGIGAAARLQRSDTLDAWLATLLPPGIHVGVALVAVGGLGRGECAPHSDLDLVLLHDDRPDADAIGTAIWYAIWDARHALDHATRSLGEALTVADTDLRVALGMLDARLIAGDPELFSRLHTSAVTRWRRDARRRLPELAQLTRRRWEVHGELAFLLEGDVKESRGGLRDFGVLRGVGYAGAADAARPAVRAAHRFLLDVRDAMHTMRGRRIDRLLAQDREEVARLLDCPDGDTVLRRIAEAARTTAHAVDDALRAAERWAAGRPRGGTRSPIGRDVVEQNGEAVLARAAIAPKPEPCLALRVAAAAARANLPIARATLEWLAAFGPPLPEPWPASARDALITLLGSGNGLVATWEACDRYGLVTTWLPELARVRSLPQHNPVHRFTVDRHMVEATRRAAELTREVDRPDLLLLSVLLHDIGKGLPGDHSTVGAPIAAAMARRIGLSLADVDIVERVVRIHLLLPDTATRRDLEDPATITAVAEAVGDRTTLALLFALARVDAAATGPAAWSTWKGRLIAELVGRVDKVLDTGVVPRPKPPDLRAIARDELPVIKVETDLVEVIAAHSRMLLPSVAGCLSLHRLDVVAADTFVADGIVRLAFAIQPRFGQEPEYGPLVADLRRAVRNDLDIEARLAARARSARTVARGGSTRAAPKVVWQPATDAMILELRAADSPGLLYRVTRALSEASVEVRAARISTLGADVVDAFYLVGDERQWGDDNRRKEIADAVVDAACGGADTLAGASTRRPS